MARLAAQTALRAAAVTLLGDYKAEVDQTLQIYRARPRSINPPTAFIDLIRETISYTGLNRREPIADIIVVHGLYDSGEAVDQKDAFVDGFIDWAFDHLHQMDATAINGVVDTEDIPDYVPEWLPPAEQKTYYATRISLGGLVLSG